MRLETRRTRAGSRLIALYELLKSWGLFVQDSWRMKPNLTVNMGLRWDFVSPNKDQHREVSLDEAPGCIRPDRLSAISSTPARSR